MREALIVLAEPTRLRIVALLAHGGLCVCHIEEALALTENTVERTFLAGRLDEVNGY